MIFFAALYSPYLSLHELYINISTRLPQHAVPATKRGCFSLASVDDVSPTTFCFFPLLFFIYKKLIIRLLDGFIYFLTLIKRLLSLLLPNKVGFFVFNLFHQSRSSAFSVLQYGCHMWPQTHSPRPSPGKPSDDLPLSVNMVYSSIFVQLFDL